MENKTKLYVFVQVIEVLIRAEDGLSRDVVKHLNYVSVNSSIPCVVQCG
jgi:hypothetical protein